MLVESEKSNTLGNRYCKNPFRFDPKCFDRLDFELSFHRAPGTLPNNAAVKRGVGKIARRKVSKSPFIDSRLNIPFVDLALKKSLERTAHVTSHGFGIVFVLPAKAKQNRP